MLKEHLCGPDLDIQGYDDGHDKLVTLAEFMIALPEWDIEKTGNLKYRLQKIALDSYHFLDFSYSIPFETVLLITKAYSVTIQDNYLDQNVGLKYKFYRDACSKISLCHLIEHFFYKKVHEAKPNDYIRMVIWLGGVN